MYNLSDTSQINAPTHGPQGTSTSGTPPTSVKNSYYLAVLVCCNTHLWALIATDANAADPNFLESQIAQLSTRQSEQVRQSLGCAFLFQLCYDIINSSWNNQHDISVTETLITWYRIPTLMTKVFMVLSVPTAKCEETAQYLQTGHCHLLLCPFQSATHPTN